MPVNNFDDYAHDPTMKKLSGCEISQFLKSLDEGQAVLLSKLIPQIEKDEKKEKKSGIVIKSGDSDQKKKNPEKVESTEENQSAKKNESTLSSL